MDKAYIFNQELFDKVLFRLNGRFSTQKSKAETLGISQSSMSRLKNGTRKPTIGELIKVANKTGFSPADFFTFKNFL